MRALFSEQHIEALAREFGTPCYIYDEALIERNIARFIGLRYPHTSIHFASMANNNPDLLRLLQRRGLGIFVNSRKHLDLAFRCGFRADEIIYTSTGVRRADLEYIASRGVAVNIDSLGQLDLFGKVCPGSSCGIRLNIDEKSQGNIFIGSESRIGLLESEFAYIHAIAKQHQLDIRGTHVYLGTNIFDLETMLSGVRRTLELSDAFPDLEYVDLGGGFPVEDGDSEAFDYTEYDRRISALFEEYSSHRGRAIRLILEPGRALFGDTAVFCTSVLDVKERPDRFLIAVDASATLLPRSMFYSGEFHRASVLEKGGEPVLEKPCDIVGSTTYSRDFLAKGVQLPRLNIEDILVFSNTGSYCYSMITQFLGQTEPCEVLLNVDGSTTLIRDRETVGSVA